MRDIRIRLRVPVLVFTGILLFVLASNAIDASESSYAVDWFEINSGAVLTASGFRLAGVAGQADVAVLSGGLYKLGGGFFAHSGVQDFHQVFLPLVLRSP